MNQIPNIEETNTREIEDKLEKLESIILLRVDRLFIEGTVILLKDYKETLAQQIRAELHHQLQKARQDWLQEEIVRLEGILVPPYPHEGAHGDAISLAAQRGYQDALQTIIDRYHSELDQAPEKLPKAPESELDQDNK